MGKNKNDNCLGLKPTSYQKEQLDLATQFMLNYMDIAMSIYEWRGLPETVTSDIIERFLFWRGMAVFFETEETGKICLPPTIYNYLNVYGLPQQFGATGVNGQTFTGLNTSNSVIIKNSPNYVPTFIEVQRLCEELANAYGARRINVNACKTPYVLSGDEKELLSMKNYFEQVSGNSPVIYKNKNKASSDISLEVANTEVEYLGGELTTLITAIKGEILTYLGLANTTIEKKERLVADEVDANAEEVNNYLYTRLKERKLACEQINKMFGTNITVDYNKKLLKEYGIVVKEEQPKESEE